MRFDRRTSVVAAGVAAVLALAAVLVVVVTGDGTDDLETSGSSSSTTLLDTTTTERSTSSSSSSSSSSSTTTASTTTTTVGATQPPSTAAPSTTTAPGRDPFLSVRIRLVRVTTTSYPIAMAVRPSDRSVWIASKGGSVCKLSGGSCTKRQTVASVSTGSEQGLLGIAFSPNGSRLYTSYTNPAGDTRVDRHTMSGDSIGSGQTIFSQDQPYSNHNGGGIAFGPDGRLWLGLGDGGSGGDPHNYAQNMSSRLGKMLRINTADNSVQIAVSGVRNPWRWSFDRATGALWIGDVGQGNWEEVDVLPEGQQVGVNLGWSRYEGTHLYRADRSAPGARPPIYEYPHDGRCSITGGYVYRGSDIPGLRGAYLFSDYCDGVIRALKTASGRVGAVRSFGISPGSVVSFGQDARGELYVLTADGGVHRVEPA